MHHHDADLLSDFWPACLRDRIAPVESPLGVKEITANTPIKTKTPIEIEMISFFGGCIGIFWVKLS